MTAPAQKIIPFAFDDQLVRVYKPNGEPWFVGRDVCHVLGLGNESKALGRLDADERQDGVSISDPMGREQNVIVISEAGVYRLVFSSRKPEAERFKRWLAHEVLPQLRRHGFYGAPGAPAEPLLEFPREDAALSEHLAKIATLRECRLIHGTRAAARLWKRLGLPAVEESAVYEADDGRACLAQLLSEVVIYDDAFGKHRTLRWMLDLALDDDLAAEQKLRADYDIRVLREQDAFVVANNGMKLAAIFAETAWADGRWRGALRKLPGASPSKRMQYGATQRRGTIIPAILLDEPPQAPTNVIPLRPV